MNRARLLVALVCAQTVNAAADPPNPLVTGLKNPTGIAVGTDGRIYVTVAGEPKKDGDGAVVVLQGGKAVPFATGLNDPAGIVAWQGLLYVADRNRVWRIQPTGRAEVFVSQTAFPREPKHLSHLAVDEGGALFVSELGDGALSGAIFRIQPRGDVDLVAAPPRAPWLSRPTGLALDGSSHLLVVTGQGDLHRLKLGTGTTERVAEGVQGGALNWDKFGRLFLSDEKKGQVFAIMRPGEKPVLLADRLGAPTGLCVDASGKHLLIVDSKAGSVTPYLANPPDLPLVDETPLALEPAVAFPDLQWTGWKPENDAGKPVSLRPIVLTHAGDGSNRVFLATQHGVIHVFPNDQKATKTDIFLDLQDRVRYSDESNEEGFLGLAFHPEFKKTGEFYAFYTLKKDKLVNVLSRFRVRRDEPHRGDPASEEVLLRITRPFWNHDGGTVCFGPDGYLYLALGDGGSANDPHGNGQKLDTLLGKVLRLDVNRKDAGKTYAIPKDNPFVDRPAVHPEIWAYGFRNIWRMAFDRKTGRLWAADVGQNLYEEIDLVERGGNYGWNVREALHPFGARGAGPRSDLIDPIWEYHHDIGKSLTGGTVYRGKRLPELEGGYLYADYVSGKMWALWYDETKRRVTANRPIRDRSIAVLSFGEDEEGDVYFLAASATGKGIYRLVRTAGKAP